MAKRTVRIIRKRVEKIDKPGASEIDTGTDGSIAGIVGTESDDNDGEISNPSGEIGSGDGEEIGVDPATIQRPERKRRGRKPGGKNKPRTKNDGGQTAQVSNALKSSLGGVASLGAWIISKLFEKMNIAMTPAEYEELVVRCREVQAQYPLVDFIQLSPKAQAWTALGLYGGEIVGKRVIEKIIVKKMEGMEL